MPVCLTCGFETPIECDEIIHVRDPTLRRESIHIYVLEKSFIVGYGAMYIPELYPLLLVPPRVKIKAILESIELNRELDVFFNQTQEFREQFMNSLDSDSCFTG